MTTSEKVYPVLSGQYCQRSFSNIELKGSSVKKAALNNDEVKSVLYDLKAGEEGKAKYLFKANIGAEKDALMKELMIYDPYVYDLTATYGDLDRSITEKVSVPTGSIEDHGHIKISISPSLVTVIEGAVKYLKGYPHLCLEQRISRAFGYLGAYKLGRFLDTKVSAAAARKEIQETIDVTRKYFARDKGLSFWSGADKGYYYLSYYVGIALIDLEKEGYKVPKQYYQNLDEYFRTKFNDYVKEEEKSNSRYNNIAKLMAFNYLAKRKTIDSAQYERATHNKEEYQLTARLLLADSLSEISRYKGKALDIFNGCSNYRVQESGKVFYEDKEAVWFSYMIDPLMYNNILALRIWLKLKPQDKKCIELMRYLQTTQRKKGYWLNTQENAQIVLAFMEYSRKYEKVPPNFSAKVTLGSKDLGRHYINKERAKPVSITDPIKKIPAKQELLKINKKGTGRGYYRIEVKHAVAGFDAGPINAGFQVTRKYYDRKGKVVANDQFKAGELYKIKLTMKINNSKDFVVLEDHVPAGFQVINPTLGGNYELLAQKFSDYKKGRSYKNYYWIDHHELRFARTSAYGTDLRPGKYYFTYYARAMHPGEYTAKAPYAEEMYNPEVRGRGLSSRINIVEQ